MALPAAGPALGRGRAGGTQKALLPVREFLPASKMAIVHSTDWPTPAPLLNSSEPDGSAAEATSDPSSHAWPEPAWAAASGRAPLASQAMFADARLAEYSHLKRCLAEGPSKPSWAAKVEQHTRNLLEDRC